MLFQVKLSTKAPRRQGSSSSSYFRTYRHCKSGGLLDSIAVSQFKNRETTAATPLRVLQKFQLSHYSWPQTPKQHFENRPALALKKVTQKWFLHVKMGFQEHTIFTSWSAPMSPDNLVLTLQRLVRTTLSPGNHNHNERDAKSNLNSTDRN